jgi:hypothetical protein
LRKRERTKITQQCIGLTFGSRLIELGLALVHGLIDLTRRLIADFLHLVHESHGSTSGSVVRASVTDHLGA